MITCEKLSRYYGKDDTQVAAVDHVSFSISRGEQVAITGKSGCGKSTLINLLATIDQPTSGSYRFSDTDVTRLNENQRVDLRRHHISVIFQQYNLIRDLTAQENILLPFHFSKRKVDKALYHRLLETLNLSDRLHHLPDQLSGGQQQRVAICRALVTQPELVLADEPTGNLDTSTSQDVMKAIQESCQAYGQTLVLVTHDVEIAHKLNRVIQMSDGRIVSDQLCSRKD